LLERPDRPFKLGGFLPDTNIHGFCEFLSKYDDSDFTYMDGTEPKITIESKHFYLSEVGTFDCDVSLLKKFLIPDYQEK